MPCTAHEARQACPTAWRRFATQKGIQLQKATYRQHTQSAGNSLMHSARRIESIQTAFRAEASHEGNARYTCRAITRTRPLRREGGCWERLLGKDEPVATESASPVIARWWQRNE